MALYNNQQAAPEDRGLADFERLCFQANVGEACWHLADLRFLQKGQEAKFKEAAVSGCKLGDANSCGLVGWHLHHKEQKLELALSMYRKACTDRVDYYCGEVAALSYQLNPDPALLPELERYCHKDSVRHACEHLAVAYKQKGSDKWAPALLKACELGNPFACAFIGNHEYDQGNEELGQKFARKSCEMNFGPGCFTIAAMLDLKKDEATYGARIDADVHKACELKDGKACLWGAERAEIRNDATSKQNYLEKGCQLQNQTSCAFLADALRVSKLPENLERAQELSKTSCDAGIALGCMTRSQLNRQDSKVALPALVRSCELLNTKNDKEWYKWCSLAGQKMERKKPEQALTLYTKACSGGYKRGCAHEVRLKIKLAPATASKPEIVQRLHELCALELESYTCRTLSNMYARGEGVPKNKAKASLFGKKAKEIRDKTPIYGILIVGQQKKAKDKKSAINEPTKPKDSK